MVHWNLEPVRGLAPRSEVYKTPALLGELYRQIGGDYRNRTYSPSLQKIEPHQINPHEWCAGTSTKSERVDQNPQLFGTLERIRTFTIRRLKPLPLPLGYKSIIFRIRRGSRTPTILRPQIFICTSVPSMRCLSQHPNS